MKRTLIALATLGLTTAPAFAEGHASGDVAEGEKAFKQCIACHVVVNADGETLAGRKAKTGPNLYTMVGGQAGVVDGFRYSSSMVEAGEAGLVWDEAAFVAYVQDPTGYLREFLDDSGARGKMSYKVRKEEDAVNLYAYLASIGAQPEAMEEEATTN
ncbi:cytochrome c family protein [Nereida sp. MMG025]|uniref:c-type cytochrome n=1 Tax=Nereida sp. MMG025 TaxID=2909981 RepID=UPI001F32830A|nr:cytochrome C [Nereida sp. MMG025]MCF6446003.1 cytochrome C [Nereida sp. MMG025]